MEDKIKEYEKYIKEKVKKGMGPVERLKVAEYHREMVENFQHERLVHLIIMLFFVGVSLGLLTVFAILVYNVGLLVELTPFYLLCLIVVILTACYIRHYYFLENHIQGLYKYTKQLRK